MVLCDLPTDNFFLTWFALTALGLVSLFAFSGTLFYKYYVNPTYEQWIWKSNPKYPTPEKVRDEIFQMIKGAITGTVLPAMALTLAKTGHSKAFCNAEKGYAYDAMSFVCIWVGCDFFEWFYHYLGHKFVFMWQFHRAHHVFFNPSPFAVIADEYVDMFLRSSPMLIIPLLFPINMDLLFGTFAVFFYGYGTYLHWGYETPWLSAHNPVINTAFQHYCHHAVSGRKTVYHTGFFFKLWDQLAGSVYPKDCFCARCQQDQGKRSKEAFEKVVKPDYSVLLDPGFWFNRGTLEFDKTVNEVKQVRGGKEDL